jgi:hypothetical protein
MSKTLTVAALKRLSRSTGKSTHAKRTAREAVSRTDTLIHSMGQFRNFSQGLANENGSHTLPAHRPL